MRGKWQWESRQGSMGDKRNAEEGKDEGEDERGEDGQKVDGSNVEKRKNQEIFRSDISVGEQARCKEHMGVR